MGRVTTLVVGLLVIALFFTGLTTFLSGLQQEYGFTADENFTQLYEDLNVTYVQEETYALQDNINSSTDAWEQEAGGGTNWYSWFDWGLKSFGTTFKAVSRSGAVASTMVSSAGGAGADAVGIPPEAINVLVVIIMITIGLMIAGYILNRDL